MKGPNNTRTPTINSGSKTLFQRIHHSYYTGESASHVNKSYIARLTIAHVLKHSEQNTRFWRQTEPYDNALTRQQLRSLPCFTWECVGIFCSLIGLPAPGINGRAPFVRSCRLSARVLGAITIPCTPLGINSISAGSQVDIATVWYWPNRQQDQ